MLAVIYHEAATDNADVIPKLRSLLVTLLGCNCHLSSIKSRFTPHAPVTIATSSWCALLLSYLIVTPCHSLSCDERNYLR